MRLNAGHKNSTKTVLSRSLNALKEHNDYIVFRQGKRSLLERILKML